MEELVDASPTWHTFEQASNLPELSVLTDWISDFLCNGHAALGRSGEVCPFTRPAIASGSIFFAVDPATEADAATLMPKASAMKQRFAGLEAPNEALKCLLLVFPHLQRTSFPVIDAVQRACKSAFVEAGLMIGQFHPYNDEPGLWSVDFRPLRAPLPLLAVRKMAVTDVAFLHATAEWRAAYVRVFGERGERALRNLAAYRSALPEPRGTHHDIHS